MASNDLPARARRAYEWGRLRWSLRLVPWAAAAMLLALVLGRPAALCGCVGGALVTALVLVGVRGGGASRGAPLGLLAGFAPLALPLLARGLGDACSSTLCLSLCLPACGLGGALAGGLLAVRAPGQGRAFLASALVIALLTGCLGCTLAGMSGVFGMLAGGALASAPVLVFARRAQ